MPPPPRPYSKLLGSIEARPGHPAEVVAAAKELGGEVVVKIQAWTTGRAGIGEVALAKRPEDVRAGWESESVRGEKSKNNN